MDREVYLQPSSSLDESSSRRSAAFDQSEWSDRESSKIVRRDSSWEKSLLFFRLLEEVEGSVGVRVGALVGSNSKVDVPVDCLLTEDPMATEEVGAFLYLLRA